MPQTVTCPAFSGHPNDWLSPTDKHLDTYGVGLRGDLHPISLFSSAAGTFVPEAAAPLIVFDAVIIIQSISIVKMVRIISQKIAIYKKQCYNKLKICTGQPWNGKIPAVPSRRRWTFSRHASLEKSEKAHGTQASRAGIQALRMNRQTLGDGLAALLLRQKSPFGDFFFL